MALKGPEAFRTISEVADELDLPQHVLRFWETRFTQIRPMKRGGGRRYYRPDDVELLRGIRVLLYGEGYTIRGVQRLLKEQGPRFVVATGRRRTSSAPPEPDADDEMITLRGPQRRAPGRAARVPRVSALADEEDVDATETATETATVDVVRAAGVHVSDETEDDTSSEETAEATDDEADASDDSVDAEDEDDDDAPDADEDEDGDSSEADDTETATDTAADVPPLDPRTFRPTPQRVVSVAVPSRATPTAVRTPAPRAAPGSRSTLAPEDVRRLHGALTQLLELKRMLDQARG